MNVLVICDGEASSATIVMENIAKHSKYDLDIQQWTPKGKITKETDIVYLHYGGLLTENELTMQATIRNHPEVKWIGGLRGMLNFKRWVPAWPPTEFCDFISLLDGISASNLKFYDLAKKIISRGEVFLCHSGVDTEAFKPTPLPEEFCIGWAGTNSSGAKMFRNFTELPFPMRTATDLGTWYSVAEMPKFYEKISVYVSTSVEEGCPLPPFEAAASGRIVIAINCGSLPEWVPKEYLVENYNNSYKLLIPIIKLFQEDPSLLEKESKRFRELSLKWDYKYTVKEYDLMFEKVMNQ